MSVVGGSNGIQAHDVASEFANVDSPSGQNDTEMDMGSENAAEDDDEEEDDDEDDDEADDGAIGEISDRDEEEDDDDEDGDEEEDTKPQTTSTSAAGTQRTASESRNRRDSHDVAFDAELDPDLYGLRRSVSTFHATC